MLFLSLVFGLVLLIGGADLLVRGAVRLAAALGLSPLVIGLTVVGFGTSMPELAASLKAALAGSAGIAVGNIVGSNIANILLILGLAALIRPFAIERADFRRDGTALALATGLALAVLAAGRLGPLGGLAGLAGLGLYLTMALRAPGPLPALAEAGTLPAGKAGSLPLAGLATLAGIAMTVAGAAMLVDAATALADAAGIPEAVIGLTLVALGTSLPEVVTSVAAAIRGQSGIAFGNVVGSNIFNALGILGITALVAPVSVPEGMALRDGAAMALSALGLIALAAGPGRMSRLAGAAFLAAYGGYLAVLAG